MYSHFCQIDIHNNHLKIYVNNRFSVNNSKNICFHLKQELWKNFCFFKIILLKILVLSLEKNIHIYLSYLINYVFFSMYILYNIFFECFSILWTFLFCIN